MNSPIPAFWRKTAPYLLLALAVFVAYANLYGNQFLFDDQTLIVENEFLRYWHYLPTLFTTPIMAGSHTNSDFYRPLQTFLYFFIYQFSDLSTVGYHLLNVSLHAANACLLYRLGVKLRFNAVAVFIAALLWAVHPIHTEAVTYISGTADGLYSFFCLLGLVLLAPDFTSRKILLAVLFCALALLSKEAAVVFPLLLMACLFVTQSDRFNPKTYIRTWPLWLLVVFYLFVRMAVLSFDSREFVNIHPELFDYGTHLSLRIYTFIATLPSYAALLLWPHGLHMERNFPVQENILALPVLAGMLMLVAASLLFIREQKRAAIPALGFGFLWFGFAYVPQMGILIPVNALFLEHWMYLPSAGLMLGLAQALSSQIRSQNLKLIVVMLACGAACVFGFLTYQQNKTWHDPVVFYRNIIDQGETSVRAYNNLGMALIDRGEFKQAMEQFQLALKTHEAAETHQNIASLYSRMPGGGPLMVPQEMAELKRALELNPDYYQACKDLAFLYHYTGDKEKAAEYNQRLELIREKYNRYQ